MKLYTERKYREKLRAELDKELSTLSYIPMSERREHDIFVVGYPKSGHTWMQNILSGLVYGVSPALAPDAVIQDLVPDEHYRRYYRRLGDQAFFKSHSLPRADMKKAIYMARDGRDAMVSYFHYLKNRLPSVASVDEFVTYENCKYPKAWRHHVHAWLDNAHGSSMQLVRYEDLLHDWETSMEAICEFIGVSRSRGFIQRLKDESSFDKLKGKENKYGMVQPGHKNKSFFRRGQAGGYQDEMSRSAIERFEAVAADALARLGYSVPAEDQAARAGS